jgi:hypothetical protein
MEVTCKCSVCFPRKIGRGSRYKVRIAAQIDGNGFHITKQYCTV